VYSYVGCTVASVTEVSSSPTKPCASVGVGLPYAAWYAAFASPTVLGTSLFSPPMPRSMAGSTREAPVAAAADGLTLRASCSPWLTLTQRARERTRAAMRYNFADGSFL
jgi:hypothetical protein